MPKHNNFINHIAILLDASSSMLDDKKHLGVIKVTDTLIADLAQKSKDMDQETRVSVYTFAYDTECVIFDKDVLRLPSIKELYKPNGMTALIDATLKSQDDLAKTAQMYGDHAFLTYVITDGMDNHSQNRATTLASRLEGLPENWTVACMVPDHRGVNIARSQGFPAGNIIMWDATSAEGVAEIGKTISQATDAYMTMRKSGIRGSKTLFSTSLGDLNKDAIKNARLKALPKNKYQLLDVDESAPIREWVQGKGITYRLGIAFYQLSKRENIQPQKNIAVMEKKTNKIYTGAEARTVLGLPQDEVRVSPDYNPDFEVFVQSTSVNRKLVPGTKLLVLN